MIKREQERDEAKALWPPRSGDEAGGEPRTLKQKAGDTRGATHSTHYLGSSMERSIQAVFS
jgi:hypothetical protein